MYFHQIISKSNNVLDITFCKSKFFFPQITDLKPDTSYVFVVRAENAQGMSVPSEMSEEARTQGTHLRDVPIYQINEARSRLATKVIQLRNLTPVSSTSVRISWEVSELTMSQEERGLIT